MEADDIRKLTEALRARDRELYNIDEVCSTAKEILASAGMPPQLAEPFGNLLETMWRAAYCAGQYAERESRELSKE